MEFPHFIDLGKQAIRDNDWLQRSSTERQAATVAWQARSACGNSAVYGAPLDRAQAQASRREGSRRMEWHGSDLVSCCCGNALGMRQWLGNPQANRPYLPDTQSFPTLGTICKQIPSDKSAENRQEPPSSRRITAIPFRCHGNAGGHDKRSSINQKRINYYYVISLWNI